MRTTAGAAMGAGAGWGQRSRGAQAGATRPNIILIMTDDQGYGDLSLHGNPHLQTPNMDRVAKEGVQFTQFQVCPVCSPTRASLLTGRYNYRTGVVDTYIGRSLMDPKEITLPEHLRRAGYRTGIFGKWHLGDNHPMRAMDKGFDESLVIGGGGLAQPADPPPGNGYFDPVLVRNGKLEKVAGYCTDIFFREAMEFIAANAARPFFAYIALNAPHTPLQLQEEWAAPFREKGLDETTAKVYGMVKNVDDNLGKLLQQLDERQLASNTILIFLTDNGPQQRRYNAGMRGLKGTVYQGGIRVPFFLRWPKRVAAGSQVDRIAAHIDVVPTLLEACGVTPQAEVRLPRHQFDGRSLLPLLPRATAGRPSGAREASTWRDRTLHTQWHRGDEPVLFRAHAARTQRWKLVNGAELYDLVADPAEAKDVAAENPEVVAKLRAETEAWFASVRATRGGYAPPRIFLGTAKENPVMLSRQDWRGPRASWDAKGLGYWEVDVRERGRYTVRLLFAPGGKGMALLQAAGFTWQVEVSEGATEVSLSNLLWPAGETRFAPEIVRGSESVGVLWAEVRKL